MRNQRELANQFEAQRSRVRAVAYRMLGSASEADDAVQEAWLRLSRIDSDEIENLGGWLTTVVSRVCLDMLRARSSRREESLDSDGAEIIATPTTGADPEQEALMADAVGLALLIVLDSLEPAERVAFVLHDMSALPFDEIAPIVGRSATATRQLASRARRRARQAATMSNDDFMLRHDLASAFLSAVRAGDVEALLDVLDPDVVIHGGGIDPLTGQPRTARGAATVAAGAMTFARYAHETFLTLVDGSMALVWAPERQPQSILTFHVTNKRMSEIHIVDDPEELRKLDVIVIR